MKLKDFLIKCTKCLNVNGYMEITLTAGYDKNFEPTAEVFVKFECFDCKNKEQSHLATDD